MSTAATFTLFNISSTRDEAAVTFQPIDTSTVRMMRTYPDGKKHVCELPRHAARQCWKHLLAHGFSRTSRSEINRQEDAREARKAAMWTTDDVHNAQEAADA